jgi:hypothetical protein
VNPFRPALSLVALVATVACTDRSQQRFPRPEHGSLNAGAAMAPAFPSPARLRYHPRERARVLAERALPDGRRLILGEGGERWIYDEQKKTLQAGSGLAPEALLGTLEGDGETLFVGASGTIYAARSWLAAFERSIVPAEPLSTVSTAGKAILGISLRRTLLRSADYGATWSVVGPPNVAFVDVALSPAGDGLALAVPEALYRTADHGASWQRSPLPATGAFELGVAADGSLRAGSVFGERVVAADGTWAPAAATGASVARELPPPPRGPDATALAEGRAAMDGPRYLELASAAGGSGWELWQGKLDGPLAARPLAEARGCWSVRLAAFEPFVAFACFRSRNDTSAQPIELYFSESSGRAFRRLAGRLDGSLASFRLALGAGGSFVVSGVCSPAALATGCNATGIQHGNGAEPAQQAPKGARALRSPGALGALSAAPSLSDTAQALAFSYDGKRAYAVGRRTKTGRFALFVSRDAGKSFEPEDLELTPFATDDDDANVDRTPNARVEGLSAAEDGAVAITFTSYGRRVLVVTDDRGRLLSSAEPPEARALLGAAGLRAISITPTTRQLWESVDGGVTFQPVLRLPLEVCPNDAPCDLPVRCSAEGCVVGQKLSRIGWGGQLEDQASLLPPPLRPTAAPVQRRVRTPIGCLLDPSPWRALPGVHEMPNADDADLGGIDWYAVAEDGDRAGVTLHVAEKGRVAPLVLLEPSERPEERAFALVHQVEGVAAVRYRIPESLPGAVNLSDVEVVWSNFFEGKRARVRLKDGGPFGPGDYAKGTGRAQQAAPALVSVASRGLYLRLHHSGNSDQPTLFLDGKRAVSLPPVPWPSGIKLPARAEMAHVGDAHVALQMVGRGTAVLRATTQGSSYRFEAFSTGMATPGAFGLMQLTNIAYVGERAGLHLEWADDAGTAASAAVFPFQAEGDAVAAPLAVPTQLELGDKPSACGPDRRARTPRVVGSPLPGTRHPVLVSDSVEGPRTLLTGAGVLHGTPAMPCATLFDAGFVSPDGAPPARESALVSLEAPERSVLFRTVGDGEATRVEYRQMACRYDPTLEVPGEIYRALGGVR